jgi:hypothetical protein
MVSNKYRGLLNVISEKNEPAKKQPGVDYYNKIVTSGCFFMINYSAEIAPKPQELRQVPQSTQTPASIV